MREHAIPIVTRAERFLDRVALIDAGGPISYAELLARSEAAAARILEGDADIEGARVAFLTPPSVDYAVAQWGIWRAGGIAVPLCTTHPAPELDYAIADSDASIVLAHPQFDALVQPIAQRRGLRFISTSELAGERRAALPQVAAERGAQLLYTSGTSGKPKGVLTSHQVLAAQMQSIVQAWEYSERDRVLHVLPLHHLHGILNLLCCALWSGASCEFMPHFAAEAVWDRIAQGHELSLFMAVPAIYAKLIQAFERATPDQQQRIGAGCRRLRLMVSGSAALPVNVLERVREISGHVLLERYGMTEFGMGLGNPLHGPRRAGSVGVPFPGVSVSLRDDAGHEVADGESGEIHVKSPGLFIEYWRKPDATRAAFTADGWFKTGDIALCDAEGMYRILGRKALDILKTGGYKVSALEIEETLREHPAVRDCAVVGVPDAVWGQRVAAVVVLAPGATLDLPTLRAWGKQRLAPYKVPSLLHTVSELPRNAMGKVQKSELAMLAATAPHD